MKRSAQTRARGFSLLELLVVVSMGIVVAAIAIPSMMTVIANFRLRGGMNSLSGLLQNCRMIAVQKNTIMTAKFTVMAGGPVAYVKKAGDTSALNNTDPQAELGAPVTQVTTPTGTGAPPALTSATLGFTPQTYQPSTSLPGFNSRGLPCSYASGVCTAGVGYAFYFSDTRPMTKSAWAAVTITPAGRVKTWFWNGGAWVN